MDKKKLKPIIIIVEMAVLFFLFVYVNTNIESAKMSELNLNFNFESGFYSEDIVVEIYPDSYVPKTSKIYYTLDGNDPDIRRSASQQQRYNVLHARSSAR